MPLPVRPPFSAPYTNQYPLSRKYKPITKPNKTCPSELRPGYKISALNGVYLSIGTGSSTHTVLFYIISCANSAINKPIRSHDTTFRVGDRAQYCRTRANLIRCNRAANPAYKQKIEDHFMDNNPWQVWQGLQHLPDSVNTDAPLAEELNSFFYLRHRGQIQLHCHLKPPALPHSLCRNMK